jgi:hypothetical protein
MAERSMTGISLNDGVRFSSNVEVRRLSAPVSYFATIVGRFVNWEGDEVKGGLSGADGGGSLWCVGVFLSGILIRRICRGWRAIADNGRLIRVGTAPQFRSWGEGG